MGTDTRARYDAAALEEWGATLFTKAGMPADRAAIVSKYLLEADLMGHDTHGFAQAPRYLRHTQSGEMPPLGDPVVLHDKGPCLTWDGNYMSGVWLTYIAVKEAVARAKQFGIGAVSIRRSHHIACLAAFLQLATDEGMVISLLSSDPAAKGVAPFGSVEQVFTPNPMAYGIPTGPEAGGDPILVDISASITTIGMSSRMIGLGKPMSGQFFIDNKGNASNDPAVLKADPPGALLPLGGMESGHKGFGLALMVEAMTSGLGGYGRADGATNTGASVLVQVTDPDAFGGREGFLREVSYTANACRNARVPDGKPPVRLPGDGALARKRAALANGVTLYEGILPDLEPIARELGVPMPSPL